MEHTRVDEGVKRGKRQYHHPKAKRAPEGSSWTIPVGLDADQVLMQYLAAQSTSGIAAQLGIRRSVLTRWLCEVRPKEWKEIQVIRALCTKEDGQEQIYDSTTALSLARARELLRSAQWDLERLDSANYGPKQEHIVTVQPVLSITVVAAIPNAALLPDNQPGPALIEHQQPVDK